MGRSRVAYVSPVTQLIRGDGAIRAARLDAGMRRGSAINRTWLRSFGAKVLFEQPGSMPGCEGSLRLL